MPGELPELTLDVSVTHLAWRSWVPLWARRLVRSAFMEEYDTAKQPCADFNLLIEATGRVK